MSSAVCPPSDSFIHPFFLVRNRESHHQSRYANIGKMRVYIYDADKISETDKASIVDIAKANCVNMNKTEPEVYVNVK